MSGTLPAGYLTSAEAASRLGIPYRSLMLLVEAGVLQPYVVGTQRKPPRLWSETHLREARLVRMLQAEGFDQHALRAALDVVRAEPRAWTDEFLLIVTRRGSATLRWKDEPLRFALLPDEPCGVVVDLAQFTQEGGETHAR